MNDNNGCKHVFINRLSSYKLTHLRMDTENSCFEKEDWEAKEKDAVLFELKEKLGKSSAQFIFPPPREG